jgi:outer membrane receptor protein involved in Fe transport
MRSMQIGLVVLVVVSLLSPSPAAAQVSSGRILGIVADDSGAVLPGAVIVVRNLGTGVTRDVVSNERGQYDVPGLPPARYQVDAELTGFRRVSHGPIVVQVNQETRLDLVLALGELAETITVQGTGTVVQTTTAAIGKVVEEKQIVALPLTDRNFASLGLLVPGVTTRGQSTTDAAYVVHGQRTDANNFQLDGVANVTLGGNTVQARPNVDAVQEFKIQTSNFSAEFGRNAGSVVQVVTKSGTNELRGSAWEFVRNDRFQSPNFFTQGEPPPLRQNQYGGTAGGPLTIPGLYSGKNRTFVFGSYEGYGLTRGLTRQTVVATAQERTGNLGFLSKPIVDPLTGLPFAGNIIPADRISPAARKLLDLMPLPNIAGAAARQNNFVSSPTREDNYDQFMARIDHSISTKWNLFYRHFFQDTDSFNPFQGAGPANYLGFPTQGTTRIQHGTFGVSTVLGSAQLNEFRVGFASNSNVSLNLPLLNPVDFGVNYVRPQDTAGGLGLPDFTITGMSGIGGQIQGPTKNPSREWQMSDVYSLALGRHYLKAGGEMRQGNDDFDLGFFFAGRFVFNGTYTGDSFADFLLGRAVEFNYAKGRTRLIMQNANYGAFVQDDFKVRDNLTLNLGIRYDYYSPIVDELGQTSTFIVDQPYTANLPQSGVAEVIDSGTHGLPTHATYFPDRNNFQPRVGFAWDVNGRGKVSVRGGGGIFHNQLRNNLALQHILSYPYQEQPVIRDTTLENPIKPQTGSPIIGQLYATDPDIVTPYAVAYSLGVQWQFMPNTLLEVAYVGNRGRDLLQFEEMNQPIFVAGQTTAANKDLYRPYRGFSSVLRSTNWGKSTYNGIETSVQRRFSGGLGFQVAYTRSHAMDYSSGFHSGATSTLYLLKPQDTNNLAPEWADADFDARHRLVVSEIWELPFGANRRWLREGVWSHVAGGWSASGIYTFQSGFPYNVFDGNDPCLRAGGYTATCRPNLVGDPDLAGSERSATRWFNTAAFQKTAAGDFGTTPRNAIRGPSLRNVDLSFSRRVGLGAARRGMNLELRVDVFNAFNAVNFGVPQLNIASSAFGRISATATDAREFQFGVKFNF